MILKRFYAFGALFIFQILFFSSGLYSQERSRIENIFFDKNEIKDIISIDLQKEVKINSFILKAPERIVIDINNAYLPSIQFSRLISGWCSEKIRASQFKKNRARIVIDIKKNSDYNFKIFKSPKKSFYSVKIEIIPENKKDSVVKNNITTGNKAESELQDTEDESGSFAFSDKTVPDALFDEETDHRDNNFSVSGSFLNRCSADIKKDDKVENQTVFRNRSIVKAAYKKNITASALSDYTYKSPKDHDYDLYLHEAYFRTRKSFFEISAGKQIIRWGKTDQLSPVDTINPENLRHFVTYDYEDRKIPIWLADIKIYTPVFNIEAVYIPFFKNARTDYYDSDWALFPHLKEEIKRSDLPDSAKTYFNNIKIKENIPDNKNEYGLRIFKTFKTLDLGMTWHKTCQDIPFITNFPVKNLDVTSTSLSEIKQATDISNFKNEDIVTTYKNSYVYGAEFETVAIGFGLRGEAAVVNKESFITSSMESIQKVSSEYVLGVDHNFSGNIYTNLNFVFKKIHDYEDSILFYKKENFAIFGEVTKDIVLKWTSIGFDYYYETTSSSGLFSPKITNYYFDNIDISIGADFFFGKSSTNMGRYKDNNQVFLSFNFFI